MTRCRASCFTWNLAEILVTFRFLVQASEDGFRSSARRCSHRSMISSSDGSTMQSWPILALICPRRPPQTPPPVAGQIPPGKASRLCIVCCSADDARGGLLQSVALSLELKHGGVMHEAVQDGGGHGVVAEVLAPVLDDAVGGDDDTAAQFVAPVHHGLQQLGTGVGDAARQEQIVEHEQVRLGALAQHALLCVVGGEGVAGE